MADIRRSIARDVPSSSRDIAKHVKGRRIRRNKNYGEKRFSLLSFSLFLKVISHAAHARRAIALREDIFANKIRRRARAR